MTDRTLGTEGLSGAAAGREVAEDERQIHRLMALYGQLLDDRRIDEWAELFLEDARFMDNVGRPAIVAAIAGGQPSTPAKHVACSTVIDLDGDRASAWTDALGLVDVGEGPGASRDYALFPLRYYDRLVRAGGRWRFASRDVRLPGAPLPSGAVDTPSS